MVDGPLLAIRHQVSGALEKTTLDPKLIEQQPKEEVMATEDKGKGTAQVREQEEQKEKEVVLEKVAHLEALTKQKPQTLPTPTNLTTSRMALFSNPSSPQTTPTEEDLSPALTKAQYGS